MARKVFFSFHYERDVWRVGQVRNCNVVSDEDALGFIDSVEWEKIQRGGDEAIEQWINEQLKGTTATAVLIGTETASRPWVKHEILKSWNRGNGVVGIWIHNVRDESGNADDKGRNPFDVFQLPDGTRLSLVCRTYDWVVDDGRKHFGDWIEEAVGIRAKYGDNKIAEIGLGTSKTAKAFTIPLASASAGFAPKAPWCPSNANRRR